MKTRTPQKPVEPRVLVAEKLLSLARILRRRGSAAEAKVAADYEQQFERDIGRKAA